MAATVKRRKLAHNQDGLRHDKLIDFASQRTAQVSIASTLVLQTDELIAEARLNDDFFNENAGARLHTLKEIIEGIAAHEPIPVSYSSPTTRYYDRSVNQSLKITEAGRTLETKFKIAIPYPEPRPTKDTPYKVSFQSPAQCNVVGSYVSKTMVKSQSRYAIDMIAQMPGTLFQDKDYLNMRYFYRRAYYIAYIAAHLQKELAKEAELAFELLNENPLLPILALTFRETKQGLKNERSTADGVAQSKLVIRLIPCAPDDQFPCAKLLPSFNCLRSSDAGAAKSADSTTPFYNNTLKAEQTFVHHLRVLKQARNECQAFSEACILGRLWLQQRRLGSDISLGGFGHFEWSILSALLLKWGGKHGKAALPASLSSTELFKAMLQFLSTTNLVKKPLILGRSDIEIASLKVTGPVVYDATQHLNILHKMTPWSANMLQTLAKSTTDLLANDAVDSFQPTFITKVDLPLQEYDIVFEVTARENHKLPTQLDRRGIVSDFSSAVYRLLKKAFGKRAQLIQIQGQHAQPWKLSSASLNQPSQLQISVVFDFAHMGRQMEHGPSAEEEKEAARFRQFWGEKAELRRFKDGGILECVEWKGNQPFVVCQEIVEYTLKRHLGISKDEIKVWGYDLTSIIKFTHLDKDAFDSTRKAFQTLERDIRNLQDLPLQIRQLATVSPSARYTSIYPPSPGSHKGILEPVDVNLYFEASSKWPENLVAIQEAKFEFLLDIDRRLTDANVKISTYLGRENMALGSSNLAYLDILYDNGAVFRLRILCDLEEIILARQAEDRTLQGHMRDAAEVTLTKLKWQYTTLPLHAQTLATFCTRLHPLSQSIRLVKHWFETHKLSGHFSEALIEIFVLHAFLHPYPWRMPTSASTGFLRTLAFLARWNWKDEPLIVDTAETLSNDDRLSIRKQLAMWRTQDPNMNRNVMNITTSYDLTGLAYTRGSPSKLIASRMTHLAKAAFQLVKAESYHLDPSRLFTSSLQDYDIVIRLSPKAVKSVIREATAGVGARKHSRYKNLDERTGSVPLPMRSHPVKTLTEELNRVFEDTLIFFHGSQDDLLLGAIWNPKLQKQKFRAGLPYNFTSLDDEDDDVVEVNRPAVLLEIARTGGEMIEKVEEMEE